MAKDPAFLFYSQSFYESTRMMLPEERACYIDLLIYQHQNGKIPLDTSRLHLYCTGVVNQVVNQVLNQRFTKTDDGWYNEKMDEVMDLRKKGNPKKIAYSTLAGLFSANSLSKNQASEIKKSFNVDDYLDLEKEEIKSKIKIWFYDVVNGFVNNKINKDINKDKSISKDTFEKGVEKTFADCLEFFPEHLHPNKPETWMETIDKLNRIDKIPYETITDITKRTRDDSFWSKNFLSLTKLRKKNGDGIPYIVVFNEQIKSKVTRNAGQIAKDKLNGIS